MTTILWSCVSNNATNARERRLPFVQKRSFSWIKDIMYSWSLLCTSVPVVTPLYSHTCGHSFVLPYLWSLFCTPVPVATPFCSHTCGHSFVLPYLWPLLCTPIPVVTPLYSHTCGHPFVLPYLWSLLCIPMSLLIWMGPDVLGCLADVLIIVQEVCESRGGRPGLSVLTSLLVSVDVKNYWTVLRHWSQLVPNMSNDIWGH